MCGTPALAGLVVGAGGGGIRNGVVQRGVPCGVGGPPGPAVAGRGGDVAGGGRRSIGASGGRGWDGRGRGGGVGAWRGRVWAEVAGWAAGLGCCGTVAAVGVHGGGAVGVLRGSGRGVARRRWTRALVGAPRPAGERNGGPPDLFWFSWSGGCRGRVNPPVPVGATGSGRASDAPLSGVPRGLSHRHAGPRGPSAWWWLRRGRRGGRPERTPSPLGASAARGGGAVPGRGVR